MSTVPKRCWWWWREVNNYSKTNKIPPVHDCKYTCTLRSFQVAFGTTNATWSDHARPIYTHNCHWRQKVVTNLALCSVGKAKAIVYSLLEWSGMACIDQWPVWIRIGFFVRWWTSPLAIEWPSPYVLLWGQQRLKEVKRHKESQPWSQFWSGWLLSTSRYWALQGLKFRTSWFSR